MRQDAIVSPEVSERCSESGYSFEDKCANEIFSAASGCVCTQQFLYLMWEQRFSHRL